MKKILFTILVWTGVLSAQITFPSGFDVVSPEPIDTRFIVADSTARVNLANVYQGLRVFQESDSTFWYYGGTAFHFDNGYEVWHLSPEAAFGVYDGVPYWTGTNVGGSPYIRPLEYDVTDSPTDWRTKPIFLESNTIYFGAPDSIADWGIIPGWNTGLLTVANDSVALYIGPHTTGAPEMNTGNVFIGGNHGGYSGRYGVGFGYGAGFQSTGNYLTAVGTASGQQVTGSTGTFIGVSSGLGSSGYRQIGIGNWAGHDAFGDNTVSIGTETGDSSNSEYGVFIGNEAGRYNNGDHSIGIGYESMVLIESGQDSGSIGIGNWAGHNADAAFSIYMGWQAGVDNSADNVIALGYQAGYSNSTANQFIVKQANINAVPLIQGDFATGQVDMVSAQLTDFLELGLHTIEVGDSVLGRIFLDAADTTIKAGTGSDLVVIQDLAP